jgi:hypothetical protein
MLRLGHELLAFTRACEHLLSGEMTFTDDERNLLNYYIIELRKKFQAEQVTAEISGSPRAS